MDSLRDVVLLPSAQRTATYTSDDLNGRDADAIYVVLDVTNAGAKATGTFTLTGLGSASETELQMIMFQGYFRLR